MSRRHLPPDDPQVAVAMSALGHVLNDRGSYAEAIQVLQQAIRLQSHQGGPSSELATSIEQLADAQYYSGHYAVAESLNQQALTMDRQLYGNIHPSIADIFVNLGEIRHDQSDDIHAEQFYRQALAIKQAYYGNDHPETAMSTLASPRLSSFRADWMRRPSSFIALSRLRSNFTEKSIPRSPWP